MTPEKQEEWRNKVKEASKKWFEENPDYHPAYNYYDSGEITLPNDKTYYRVPLKMWYEYIEEIHGPMNDNPFKSKSNE